MIIVVPLSINLLKIEMNIAWLSKQTLLSDASLFTAVANEVLTPYKVLSHSDFKPVRQTIRKDGDQIALHHDPIDAHGFDPGMKMSGIMD